MLIDANFAGKPRKLLAQGNRNGFFYVLDRITGEFLMATPFVHKLTWATEIGRDGRPKVASGSEPSIERRSARQFQERPTGCLPRTIQARDCSISRRWRSARFTPSHRHGGSRGSRSTVAAIAVEISGAKPGKKFLRALDLQTGKIVWEYPEIGNAVTWGGVFDHRRKCSLLR